MYAFRKAHLRLPRTSDGQARAVRRIGRKHLHRGDLIFFHHGGNVYHAAIYLKQPQRPPHHPARAVLGHPGPSREDLDQLLVRRHPASQADPGSPASLIDSSAGRSDHSWLTPDRMRSGVSHETPVRISETRPDDLPDASNRPPLSHTYSMSFGRLSIRTSSPRSRLIGLAAVPGRSLAGADRVRRR